MFVLLVSQPLEMRDMQLLHALRREANCVLLDLQRRRSSQIANTTMASKLTSGLPGSCCS